MHPKETTNVNTLSCLDINKCVRKSVHLCACVSERTQICVSKAKLRNKSPCNMDYVAANIDLPVNLQSHIAAENRGLQHLKMFGTVYLLCLTIFDGEWCPPLIFWCDHKYYILRKTQLCEGRTVHNLKKVHKL